MSDSIYIEHAIQNHPRVLDLTTRYPNARRIFCERYNEVFNPAAQNFRLQKNNPALILAQKQSGFVLPVPEGYGVGGEHNFYFSHMLNCVYDCRYCFLQGMYRSANYVLFVNYEDFECEIDKTIGAAGDAECWFFSGYDCDSLALEGLSGFVTHFLKFFAERPRAYLELRTKSTQINSLRSHEALSNVVVAYSFTPQAISSALEHKVPSVEKRIAVLQELQQLGWPVALRFDPLIYCENYQFYYKELFAQVFAVLDSQKIHSVSLGPFRLPKSFYNNISRLYPDEALFAGPLALNKGMVSYPEEFEQEMLTFCEKEILEHVPAEIFFPCVAV